MKHRSTFPRQAANDAFGPFVGNTAAICERGAMFGAQQSSLKEGWTGRPAKGGREWLTLATVKVKGWAVPRGRKQQKQMPEKYAEAPSNQAPIQGPTRKPGQRCRTIRERDLRLAEIHRKQTPAQRRALRIVEV